MAEKESSTRLLSSGLLVCFLVSFSSAHASLCIVTRWSSWSLCLFPSNSTSRCESSGLQVRNRNVLSPSFPAADGTSGQCPHLFEVRTCRSSDCPTLESPFESEVVAVDSRVNVDFPPTSRASECKAINPRCCKENRTTCPTGRPRFLIRWFRSPGDQSCRSYRYAHCDAGQQIFESTPLTTEFDCLQSCFSEFEKAIFPSLRVI